MTDRYEQRSLTAAKWINLLMAIAGIGAAWLSNSSALQLDGLYSGVGFISAIFAARIGANALRPATRQRPYGFSADEAIYQTFRTLILVVLIVVSFVSAVTNIVNYILNGEGRDLVYGPIIVYFIGIVILCFGLAAFHAYNLRKSGGRSAILKVERQSAIVDGLLSLATGVALVGLPYLVGTPLEVIIPVGDSVILVILALAMISVPVTGFRDGLRELASISAAPANVQAMRRAARAPMDAAGMKLVDLSVTKLGRSFFVAAYVDPGAPVTAAEVDRLARALESAAGEAIGPSKVYVLVSEHGRAMPDPEPEAPATGA
ncbi:cation transporter [Oceanomicrobium pacificus]|uniref:Cation transporter n=1 Tax=Oceanomicrobium pacificus TaxID=2692916 RepID=A0A6B0TZB9_9RHOB|nr:cation transporter [Oceanomicrobium pacificus]MXU64241.1 cation transporter [Oceanomicrobium pacificus]